MIKGTAQINRNLVWHRKHMARLKARKNKLYGMVKSPYTPQKAISHIKNTYAPNFNWEAEPKKPSLFGRIKNLFRKPQI